MQKLMISPETRTWVHAELEALVEAISLELTSGHTEHPSQEFILLHKGRITMY